MKSLLYSKRSRSLQQDYISNLDEQTSFPHELPPYGLQTKNSFQPRSTAASPYPHHTPANNTNLTAHIQKHLKPLL